MIAIGHPDSNRLMRANGSKTELWNRCLLERRCSSVPELLLMTRVNKTEMVDKSVNNEKTSADINNVNLSEENKNKK